MEIQVEQYKQLVAEIGNLVVNGRENAARQVNTILVMTYWEIGRYIVEFEQKGYERAEYGSQLLDRLSRDLTLLYGKGFSRSNMLYMRKLYVFFPKRETLSHKLTWSHYFEILKSDSDLEVLFYAKQSEREKWSVRELKRQMKSLLFHRLALSTDKEGVLKLANEGHEVQEPEDLLKDPFVLEFLNIPEKQIYLESDLEERLISNLQQFLLELGKGFAFIARQYRMSIGGKHFRLDLLFYHRILKCFVLIDLKKGEIDHNDIGQMNLYLNYFKKEEATEGDNEPVGILLGAYKDHILVEYATSSITNKVLLAKYQLYLPDKRQLEKALNKLLETE
ncbi:PDDEXK nuclease domain-containing protein [Chitinophaga ginsengisoli]|uniref:Putative nuclease of restriction endonuclease-like (RecB) superfamily n=1 Tax=Chitinophaga ginsengisoli TaxID=363837 RepID=A0A2P8GH98_9BACT|nr:PDDEXK nuclease domain-containing protein [Chitinophaga ginsengisoli]PSL33342.1 putative nuclease of restriction endonuclease-like (RecB) superfamily [Chitinophaga ginsengisoli]